MRKPLRIVTRVVTRVVCLVLVSLPLCVSWPGVRAQESDPVVAWQVAINQARLDRGLAPYGFARRLAAAAQRHADDVAARGFANPDDVHLGSDGTHEHQRIAEAGYAAWKWVGGNLIVDENLWSGQGSVDDAMAWFLNSSAHSDNLFSTVYREMGVGVATDADDRSYYVLTFGARPNGLPIFINDGAAATDSPQIAVHLTNEQARPEGEGTDYMGEAVEIRVNDAPDFDDQPWQPWETYVSWTLPDTPGEHTVYVQFRDAAGRTAESVDTIVLETDGVAPTATLIPPSPTPEPTDTPIPPTDTPEPTNTPEPTPIPTTAPEPTVTPAITATTPPPATLEPTSTPFVPVASPAAPGPTPFPTWTPLPTPVPVQVDEPEPPLGLLAALQGVALVLGAYLVLRRGRQEHTADSADDRTA